MAFLYVGSQKTYRMKKFVFLGLLSVCIGCKDTIEYQYEHQEIMSSHIAACETEYCPDIVISRLYIIEPSAIAAPINQTLENVSIALLKEGNTGATTLEATLTNYIGNIQTAYPEDITVSGHYEVHIDQQLSYSSEGLLCVFMEYYIAEGSAHGYGGVQYFNFDPETGRLYDEAMLFKDKAAFLSLAKAKFYDEQNISANNTLSDAGFFFEKDQFHLPKQIGFTNETIVLLYNIYEIAPYTSGLISLEIPLIEAREFLNFF